MELTDEQGIVRPVVSDRRAHGPRQGWVASGPSPPG